MRSVSTASLALAVMTHAAAIARQEQPALEDLLSLICEYTADCTGTATCQLLSDLIPEVSLPIGFCLESGQELPIPQKLQEETASEDPIELICMAETDCAGEATCQLLSELYPELAELPVPIGFCLEPGQEAPVLPIGSSSGPKVFRRHDGEHHDEDHEDQDDGHDGEHDGEDEKDHARDEMAGLMTSLVTFLQGMCAIGTVIVFYRVFFRKPRDVAI